MEQNMQQEICAEISAHFGIPVAQLQPEATMESLNIDSLSMIEFLFEMEDKYGISLAESREPLKTLGDVYKEIDKAIAAKEGAA